MFVIDR